MRKTRVGRALAVAALTGAVAVGVAVSPAYADGSVRLGNNEAGVVWRSSPDIFEIWDNVRDGKQVYAQYNYVAVDDSWTTMWAPVDYSTGYTVSKDLIEGRQIYIRVCRSEPLTADACSASVKTAT